ncbi:unnamed protein product [Parascedosporium putredinis]|uniref:Sugar phosphate transporter domain-containing protein n=1 Tax=Parascedosporium putredinis TaxID=1442378 RepID=A0A9P1GZA0_9PEZI|nr:unnamed protein product [Parascedosporium putredinis]CAI7990675.1 unnamed protein product [Parascedosporium putredinis]
MTNPSLPITEKPTAGGFSLHPGFYVLNWMFFSNMTILFNKWLIDTAGFKYPVLLTCWHLVFATLATQILAKTTTLVDGRKRVKMTGRVYLRAVVPIGVLYSGSLVCSNLVYLYLNVAFIQMLKAAAPVAVLFISWVWGVANPTLENVVNVIGIAFGVFLASAGEIDFSWIGFAFQFGGIVFEAMRLVMIQLLLSGDDMKMDPLVSLYYYAPVCAVMNIIVGLFTEFRTFQIAHLWDTGVFVLILNAGVAFMLNVASVFLIGKTSSLVLTLAGILKAILLVVASVIIWQTTITLLQFLGYSIALFGLVYYSIGWSQIKTLGAGAAAWSAKVYSNGFGEATGNTRIRRAVTIALVVLITFMLLIGFSRHSSEPGEGERPTQSPDSEGWGFSWMSYLGWSQ